MRLQFGTFRGRAGLPSSGFFICWSIASGDSSIFGCALTKVCIYLNHKNNDLMEVIAILTNSGGVPALLFARYVDACFAVAKRSASPETIYRVTGFSVSTGKNVSIDYRDKAKAAKKSRGLVGARTYEYSVLNGVESYVKSYR